MPRRELLTCKDVESFLVTYLDDDLDEATRQRFEGHLRRCRVCTGLLDQYRATVEALRRQPAPPVPPALAEQTLAFLREEMDKG